MKALRGRMMGVALALAVAVLAAVMPLHVAGNSTRSRALLLGLQRRYGAGGELHPVHIEGGPRVLEGVRAVGRQPVEVVSRGELTARYAGKEIAPELTTVTVTEQHGVLGLRYAVRVHSFGVRVPGATAIPWGGTHIYYFRQWGGMLWADGQSVIRH